MVPSGTVLGPGGTVFSELQSLISRSPGALLTSKSLQNSFHAKENRMRPRCFLDFGKCSEGFYKGLVLRVDSRNTRKTREKT